MLFNLMLYASVQMGLIKIMKEGEDLKTQGTHAPYWSLTVVIFSERDGTEPEWTSPSMVHPVIHPFFVYLTQTNPLSIL